MNNLPVGLNTVYYSTHLRIIHASGHGLHLLHLNTYVFVTQFIHTYNISNHRAYVSFNLTHTNIHCNWFLLP